MKILVIFTGGTIGSSIKQGGADVDQTMQHVLLKQYKNDSNIEFITSSPYSVLSENLSAIELNLLQNEIAKGLESDNDGIIVTHGTDTLQYTAAAIEIAFSNTNRPIVFVSADYPLENPKTNGHINFEAAVEFIKTKKQNGVFVSYKNNTEKKTAIHIASHILQHLELDSNIYSLDSAPFATYDKEIVFNHEPIRPESSIGTVNYMSNPGILSIESCPGNHYSYSLEQVQAIILKPYHSGTLNTSNHAFCNFCRQAKERKVPVFVMSSSTNVSYKSTELYHDLGITPIYHSTYISAYIKIWAAISLGKSADTFVNTQNAQRKLNKRPNYKRIIMNKLYIFIFSNVIN